MDIPKAFRDAAERGGDLGIDLARQGRACVHLHPNRDAVVWVVEVGGDAAFLVGRLLEGEGYGAPSEEGGCLVWRKGRMEENRESEKEWRREALEAIREEVLQEAATR